MVNERMTETVRFAAKAKEPTADPKSAVNTATARLSSRRLVWTS